MYVIVIAFGLLLAFSRAAWIGALAIAIIALWQHRVWFLGCLRAKVAIGASLGLMFVIISIIVIAFPQVIVRIGSSREHLARPIEAMKMMLAHPLGSGLGAAGPASNLTSAACVFLDAGADASWAKDRPDLCVFIGNQQTQPSKLCNCPFLPENWYLQIGIELGIAGMLLFLCLVILLLKKLHAQSASSEFSIFNFQFSILLSISIAALFLHAWEDSATAYTAWVLIAAAFSSDRQPKSSSVS